MSWTYPKTYDVIVVGGGHAGCEASLAAARMGASTLLLTMNLDTIAKMSCNPAIGGVAKGQIVREIDALGGEMGKVIDRTGIQFRMLNRSKGPAVWAPRAQADKVAYQFEMKHRLEMQAGLDIKQGTIEKLLVEDGKIVGVLTKEGIQYAASAVIISSGTFLRGLMHIGETHVHGGRSGDSPSVGLSAELERLGFNLARQKTGTPPRVNIRSIDLSCCEEQPGEEGVRFSYEEQPAPRLPQISCYITHTTLETKQLIEKNLHRSPMYSGKIEGVGPRYCPSIEDKVVRFSERERHQLFLEPEGLHTQEVYVNGISSSLPFDVQYAMIRSVPALAQAEIMRPAYAVEYDFLVSGQIDYTLETKRVEGLYCAGQINGTSGYEEAAGQGLVAGVNAALKLQGKEPFILKRHEAYIGVLIDDLVTKGTDEPYRMFTSRAEHRLLLRQDNADRRLKPIGHALGLVDSSCFELFVAKEERIEGQIEHLRRRHTQFGSKGFSLAQLMCRPEMSYSRLMEEYPDDVEDLGEQINSQIELELKYEGYIRRQQQHIERLERVEGQQIPDTLDFRGIVGLSAEAQCKLSEHRPRNLGQASRISGVTPADISVLMVALSR